MCWSDEQVAGFTLARTILERDRHERALDWVVPAAAERCDAHHAFLVAATPEARHAGLREAAAMLRGAIDMPSAEVMPSRARMWLATAAPKATGKKWLQQAPQTRRRFRPGPGLVETLRSLAQPARDAVRRAEAETRVLEEAGCLA